MATIRTSLSLYDGVTGPLRNMQQAMHSVLSSFESMQDATGNSVDIRRIEQARESWARAERQLNDIEDSVRRAGDEQDQFNRNIRGGTSAAGGLLSAIKRVAVAMGGLAAIKQGIELSDEMSATRSRLSMLAVDDKDSTAVAERKIADLEQKIMASANRSRSAFLDTSAAVAKLGSMAGDAFNNNMDEVIAFSELVNKQFVIGGAGAEEQKNAMLQLTQAMASGVLRGDELNSIFEQAPNLIQTIAEYLGVPVGKIREMASEGQITAEIVKNAMFEMADKINDKFDKMPMTWSQIGTQISNVALAAFDPVLTRLNEVANSEQFSIVIEGIINGLSTLGMIAAEVFNVLVMGASFVIENWSWISPIIFGIVAALAVYYGHLLLVRGAELVMAAASGAMAIGKGLLAAATFLVTGATWAQVTAQYGLNTAMYACPLVWILGLFIALIAVIWAVAAALAKFGGFAGSALGVVAGAVMVVIESFHQMFLLGMNIGVGLSNAFGALGHNIQAAFYNAISNVKAWFYGLLAIALTVIGGICEALNKLPFISFDFSGITSKASEYAQKSADAAGDKMEYEDVLAAFEEGMATYDAFGDGWAADAFEKGSAWGDNAADKIGDLFDFGDLPGMDEIDMSGMIPGGVPPPGGTGGRMPGGNPMDAIAANTGNTAANTAAMSDTLNYAGEELGYMRDIAEREAINRFTTAEIKIEQHNDNHIDRDTDIDGIMNAWADSFAERLDMSGEGVHV